MTNNAGPAISHNSHVELHGRHLLFERNLSHVFEFEIGMSSTTDDGDVLRATHVGDPARDIDWIIVTAARNQDSDSRAPGIVGITIRSYVLPLPARLVN